MCVLSPPEVSRFRKAAADRARGFIFTFTLATGLRPGEVQGLQWKDCDLETGTIAVRRAVAWLSDGWQFGEPKTPQSRRTIPLPSSIAEGLRQHRREQLAFRRRQLARGRLGASLDLVFPSRTGEPLYGPNVSKRVLKPILADAELELRFRWYDCRHTCATLLLAAGENPKVVSERLGHATVAFTLDRYAHVLPGMQARASERLQALLFGG
jgi:integrase